MTETIYMIPDSSVLIQFLFNRYFDTHQITFLQWITLSSLGSTGPDLFSKQHIKSIVEFLWIQTEQDYA